MLLGDSPLGDLPLADCRSPATYYQLMETAFALSKKCFYQAAVVTAHSGCEVCVARAVGRLASDRLSPEFAKALDGLRSGYNLANDRIRGIFVALSGIDDLPQQPFWAAFVESAKRRNLIVHQGMQVEPPDAEASTSACFALVDFLVQRLQLPVDDDV